MRRAACILLLVVLVGCGADEPAEEPAAEATPEATATPDERERAKEEIRRLAVDWLAASATEDAAAHCELLIPSERRYFDRLAGSCEKAYAPRGTAKERRFARNTARDSKPGTIIVHHTGYATIDIEHAKDGKYVTFYAVETDDGWGLARKKVAVP